MEAGDGLSNSSRSVKNNVGYCFSPSLSSGLRGRMQIRGICTIGGAERASVSAIDTIQRKDNGTFFCKLTAWVVSHRNYITVNIYV